jgi:hypothetical protein
MKDDKFNIFNKLSGKNDGPDSKNFLLKYTAKLKDNKKDDIVEENKEMSTQNGIGKNIPVLRKNRNNLKDIENLESSKYFSINNDNKNKKEKEETDFPIMPALKYKSEGRVKNKTSTEDLNELVSQLNIEEEKGEKTNQQEEFNEIKHEGYLYKITNTKKLKRLWFKLLHKDLYCKIFFL